MPVRELPPVLAEKARVHLNEDPKRLKDDIQCLKDWIAKQPHLRARTDDQWLLGFLRGTKFSLEKTKEKIDMHYSVRSTASDMFKIQYDNPKFNEILSLGSLTVLPKLASPDAPRVMLVRPGRYDPDKFHILDIVAVSNSLHKIVLMEDDNATVSGALTVFDLEGVSVSHLLQLTPPVMKKMVVAGQDGSPFRMKGTHCINTPAGFETIYNLIKGLLNQKNQSRFYVHNRNYEEFYKHIPKEILPVEYGGSAGTTKDIAEYWMKKVQEYSTFLEEDKKFGTDESKRLGKPRTAEDMFGLEGSFRKLEVD